MLRYCHLVWSNKRKGQGPLRDLFKGPLDATKRLRNGTKMIKKKKILSLLRAKIFFIDCQAGRELTLDCHFHLKW